MINNFAVYFSVGNQNSMQFQYPPFNIKEAQTSSLNNYKSRKSSDPSLASNYGKLHCLVNGRDGKDNIAPLIIAKAIKKYHN